VLRETDRGPRREIPLDRLLLTDGLEPAELEVLRPLLRRREIDADEVLFREGEPGNRLYILAHGAVSIVIKGPNGGDSRVVTFAPGSLFGEGAMLDSSRRSASAIAAEDAVVYSLSRVTLASLAESHPALANKLLLNLGRHLSGRLRQTTDALRELGDSAG
jgi:CRP-like cAMP-binding protein